VHYIVDKIMIKMLNCKSESVANGEKQKRICNFIDSLISSVRLFTESYLSDIHNTVPFENTTPINQNTKVKIKERRAG